MSLTAPKSAAQPAQALLAEELRCTLHRLKAIPGTEAAQDNVQRAYDAAVFLATGESERAWDVLTGSAQIA